jgi:hypothetical protein
LFPLLIRCIAHQGNDLTGFPLVYGYFTRVKGALSGKDITGISAEFDV